MHGRAPLSSQGPMRRMRAAPGSDHHPEAWHYAHNTVAHYAHNTVARFVRSVESAFGRQLPQRRVTKSPRNFRADGVSRRYVLSVARHIASPVTVMDTSRSLLTPPRKCGPPESP